jgi:hypothetical protein
MPCFIDFRQGCNQRCDVILLFRHVRFMEAGTFVAKRLGFGRRPGDLEAANLPGAGCAVDGSGDVQPLVTDQEGIDLGIIGWTARGSQVLHSKRRDGDGPIHTPISQRLAVNGPDDAALWILAAPALAA